MLGSPPVRRGILIAASRAHPSLVVRPPLHSNTRVLWGFGRKMSCFWFKGGKTSVLLPVCPANGLCSHTRPLSSRQRTSSHQTERGEMGLESLVLPGRRAGSTYGPMQHVLPRRSPACGFIYHQQWTNLHPPKMKAWLPQQHQRKGQRRASQEPTRGQRTTSAAANGDDLPEKTRLNYEVSSLPAPDSQGHCSSRLRLHRGPLQWITNPFIRALFEP